jgi:type II secretory pathway component GspD/PulD (secretin)
MPQAAHMAAYPDTNTLILSDHAANLKRILAMVDAMERNGQGCKPPEPAKQ